MQFSAREDIQAPIEAVFDMVTDFERFERMAMRRGIEVRRTVEMPEPQAGVCWETDVIIRGKPRHILVELAGFERPQLMQFQSSSKGMSGLTTLDLLSLSPQKTRLNVEMSLAAKTLPARLLLQSLKLGKSRFRRQFQMRLNEFAREMEERHLHGI